MSRQALITGVTGFVGSHTAEEFLRGGWRVKALVRNPEKLRELPLQEVEIASGSLIDRVALKAAVRGCDTVIHCAALNSALTQTEFHHINADATGELVKLARGEVGRFVYCSSQAAAGPALDGRAITEADPPQPISQYGVSKLNGERLLKEYSEGMEWIILRPSAVIGARDQQFLPLFRAVIRYGLYPQFGPGGQRYSFVCVHDLARALRAAAEAEQGLRDVYFVSHPDPVDWSHAAAVIGKFVNRRVTRLKLGRTTLSVLATIAEWAARVRKRPALLSHEKVKEILTSGWVCDGDRIRRAWNFEYRCSLENTLREAYEYYRDHGLV